MRYIRFIIISEKTKEMQAEEEQVSIDSELDKLNHIVQILINQPPIIDPHLKDYVTIYVHYHRLSDYFFMNLCENHILDLMFAAQKRLNSSVCILENLNLLLVNTRQPNQLVYIFSQKSLHAYLFNNTFNKDSEYIEYFAQLLKTILLKLKQFNKGVNLIQLFYNSKYHNFPIFTYASILAIQKNLLVRVTAQQCILLVITLCNQQKFLSNFLGELPFIYFIVELIKQFESDKCDHDGLFKYLADLFYELREHRSVLLLLNNFICNYICVRNLPKKYTIPLKFYQLLGQAVCNKITDLKQENKLKKEQCDDLLIICATHLRVLIKYLTTKFLDASYYISIIKFSQKQPIQNNFDENTLYNYFTESMPQLTSPQNLLQGTQKQKAFFKNFFIDEMKNKIFQYEKSVEFIKEQNRYLTNDEPASYMKMVGNAFGYFYKKTQKKETLEDWANKIWEFVGINSKKGKLTLQNFMVLINPSRSVFLDEFCSLFSSISQGKSVETINLGQKPEENKEQQKNYNSWRSVWGFNFQSLSIILQITNQFLELTLENKRTQILLPKMYISHTYLFLMQVKAYLQQSINQCFDKEPRNQILFSNVDCILTLLKICNKLEVKPSEHASKLFGYKMHSLQGYLQGILFENCFEAAVKYFGVRELMFVKNYKEARIFIKDEEQGNIVKALCYFECFQKMLNPDHKLLSKFYEMKWKERHQQDHKKMMLLTEKNILIECEVEFQGKKTHLELLQSQKVNKILLILLIDKQKAYQFDICRISRIKRSTLDKLVLFISPNDADCIKFQNQKEIEIFQQKFCESKLKLVEIVTSSVVQYLEYTYKELCLRNFFQEIKKKEEVTETPETPYG